MDEDAPGPLCSCGSGMDDSRLCLCLAGSLPRHRLAPRPAFISYAMVVLGHRHTCHSLGGSADPRFQQATWATNSGAFDSEPAVDVCVRLCFGGGSRRIRDCCMGWLAPHRGSCRFAARHVSLELAHLLDDSGNLASISLLRSLYCR